MIEFQVLTVMYFLNFVLLYFSMNPGFFFHITIAYLPFLLSLPLGSGLHDVAFCLLGTFYILTKALSTEIARRYEWLITSVLGILMFIGMYSVLQFVTNVFGLFLIFELLFLLGLMLVVSGKNTTSVLEIFFFPNIVYGVLIGISFVVFSYGTGSFEFDMLEDTYDYMSRYFYMHINLHLLFVTYIMAVSFKLYIWPANYYVPAFYEGLTTAQIIVFSTVFMLPYLFVASICLATLPEHFKAILFAYLTFTCYGVCDRLLVEENIKACIGLLTVFTQNVILFVLISGPAHFVQHQYYLCLVYLFFYFLSTMPFFYLLSRSDSTNLLDLRLMIFISNMFDDILFYLAWLALSGIPLTFLYVTKAATITQIMGHLGFSLGIWLYLIISFYIYVVLFLFFILSKEIYILHKKDLKTNSSQREHPWLQRAVSLLPWVLLIVLYVLFVLVALSYY